jgi:hypothetical protein
MGDATSSFDKATFRSTRTGILANYKKQLNLTADELVQKDFWDKTNSVFDDTAR